MDLLINFKYQIFLFLIFFSLFRWFSFSFALKIYSTLKMLLLSAQNNYIEFMCRRACARKIKSQFHVSGWFQGFQNLIFLLLFFENLLQSKFCHYFQAEIILWSPTFSDFLTAFHMVYKNQESCESWLVRFSVRRHSKKPKIKPTFFFERVNFAFSDVIPRGISACKILPL